MCVCVCLSRLHAKYRRREGKHHARALAREREQNARKLMDDLVAQDATEDSLYIRVSYLANSILFSAILKSKYNNLN